MSYRIYNIDTGQPYGPFRPTPYTVDGQPGVLPAHLKELQILADDYPELGPGQEALRIETPDFPSGKLLVTWQVQDIPPPVRAQDTRIILDRLTATEQQALIAARAAHWQIEVLVLKSVSTGRISEGDPDFPAARTFLDQLGVIAAARWDELFAP